MTRSTPQWLQNGTYPAAADRQLIEAIWPNGGYSGMAVTPNTGMQVNIAAGIAAVPTANSTGCTLCSSSAVENVTLSAAPGAGNNRVDLIILQTRGNDLDGGANDDFIFDKVTGTPVASPTLPTPPAVPNGALCLAEIVVPGGSASITADAITDRRPVPLDPRHKAYVRVVRTAAFTLPTTDTDFGWSSADEDDEGLWDRNGAGTEQIYIPRDGLWRVDFRCGWTSTASGQWANVALTVNGTIVAQDRRGTAAAQSNHVNVHDVLRLSRGDIVAGTRKANTTLNGITGGANTAMTVMFEGS